MSGCPSPSLATVTALSDPAVADILSNPRHRLQRCAMRRPDVASLTQCANLAVAGTGSETLSHLLGSKRNQYVHHYHVKRIRDFPAARCFIATIRDPAERLESGYRFELVNDAFNPTQPLNSLAGPFPTLGAFVDALQNTSSSRHQRALLMLQRSSLEPSRKFQHSMATLPNCWRFTSASASRLIQSKTSFSCIGSNFLVPQVDYLIGADCSRTELHFLCTRTLERDWAAMSASFSDVAAAANVSHHFHARSSEVSSISPSALERSRLNDEQKAFVRNCLYPDDTRLYRHVCETSARAGRGAATARTAGHAGLSAWQAKLFAMVEADAAEKAAVAQRILLAALQADGRHSTGVLSQGVDGGAWLNEMLAVTELTHSLHLSVALAFAARAHNHTASHFPLHLATDWEQGMRVKMVSRMGKGVGGGQLMEDAAETAIYGLRPFAAHARGSAGGEAEAAERGLYTSLNTALSDMGHTHTIYGDVTAVLRRETLDQRVIVSPVDSGAWWQLCGEGDTWTRWLWRRKYRVNCTAVQYPRDLGTLRHLEHTLRASLSFWQPQTGISLHEIARRWQAQPWGAHAHVPNARACDYIEALVMGRVSVAHSVKVFIGSITLFGTTLGARLREWAMTHGIILAWSLGPLENASCAVTATGAPPPARAPGGTQDVLSVGFERGSRDANARLLDPVVLDRSSAGANLSELVRDTAPVVERIWTLRRDGRSPATCGAWWKRLLDAHARIQSLLIAPLVPGACLDPAACIGTQLVSGKCVCYH